MYIAHVIQAVIKAIGLKDVPSREKWLLGVETVKGYQANSSTSVDEDKMV